MLFGCQETTVRCETEDRSQESGAMGAGGRRSFGENEATVEVVFREMTYIGQDGTKKNDFDAPLLYLVSH